ncbi:hypothetical protein A4G19_11640 [Pasteurellaceae bacterium Macca]|nr:hypothetical protein [Pasteurellaceae bacterium Macca]
MKKSGIKRSFFTLFLLLISWSVQAEKIGKLAIVIDDIGYRNKEDSAIYAFPQAVSVAIIPVSPHATDRAKKAHEQQRDVLIHLPMQPQGNHPVEQGALMVGMEAEKVANLIAQAQQQVPHAIGLNNHMGSRATSDKATMEKLMISLKQAQLFFLDSKTAGSSVAYRTAQDFGIKALERHIFLDSSDVLADVERQFQSAVKYARTHGSVVMIGHPRKNSIAVLERGIAQLPKDIELVPISQLWKSESQRPIKPFIMVFEVEPALTSIAPYQGVPLLRGVPKE